MAAKQVGAVYHVDCKFVDAATLRSYRETLPEHEKRCKVVKVKVLSHVKGTRSYECAVVGVQCRIKLSSKSLQSHRAAGQRRPDSASSESSSGNIEGSEESEEQSSSDEEGPPAPLPARFHAITADDWTRVNEFSDQCLADHPAFDIDRPGRLRGFVPKTPCDLFLAFFPMELLEPHFRAWSAHAEEAGRTGLQNIDESMFLVFLSLVIKMGLLGLRRREHYFTGVFKSTAMTQRTFENILYTVRDAGLGAYEAGTPYPDGRIAHVGDPLSCIRLFADQLQQEWQEAFVPGSVLVVDETMVGWTGATNIHITYLPNKPTSKGVCLKTLCDARTRVMLSFEFVEQRQEQLMKAYAEEGLAAAVTLRLCEPWHNKAPRIIIADAWFGGLPTSYALLQRGLYSITNVKAHTKHFCKKELWADARGNRNGHQRNDRAYRELKLAVKGKEVSFVGAFHMDKAPMTLLGTAGSSKEAPEVMRRRVYMSEDGDLTQWTGTLHQPDMHYIYRSTFNAVDVHNKLAMGPRSVARLGANSLPLKLFLTMVALAETNAYLLYMHLNKLSSDRYSHADFKVDLETELLKRAHTRKEEDEDKGPQTRRSGQQVATGGHVQQRHTMPASFSGHVLRRDDTKNRKCMVCGTKTKTQCSCGRAICGTAGGVTCWAWHLDSVATGSVEAQPLQWQRGKRVRP
jgi:hypothetical protein